MTEIILINIDELETIAEAMGNGASSQ